MGKLKKSEIPKPKYNIGDYVAYFKDPDSVQPMQPRVLGQIEQIFIHLTDTFTEVSYVFIGEDAEKLVPEGRIHKRIRV